MCIKGVRDQGCANHRAGLNSLGFIPRRQCTLHVCIRAGTSLIATSTALAALAFLLLAVNMARLTAWSWRHRGSGERQRGRGSSGSGVQGENLGGRDRGAETEREWAEEGGEGDQLEVLPRAGSSDGHVAASMQHAMDVVRRQINLF